MELSNIFPSKYIKASDLQGREINVAISEANIEEIGQDKKLVLYFQGKEKGLVCNRTNADRIAHAYGTNTDQWIGREIVLFTDLVPFQGKTVEAVRVRTPRVAAPPRTSAPNDTFKPKDIGGVSMMERIHTANNGPSDDIPF